MSVSCGLLPTGRFSQELKSPATTTGSRPVLMRARGGGGKARTWLPRKASYRRSLAALGLCRSSQMDGYDVELPPGRLVCGTSLAYAARRRRFSESPPNRGRVMLHQVGVAPMARRLGAEANNRLSHAWCRRGFAHPAFPPACPPASLWSRAHQLVSGSPPTAFSACSKLSVCRNGAHPCCLACRPLAPGPSSCRAATCGARTAISRATSKRRASQLRLSLRALAVRFTFEARKSDLETRRLPVPGCFRHHGLQVGTSRVAVPLPAVFTALSR